MSEISRLLVEQGRAAADARAASGAAWGNAVTDISRIPGQVITAYQQRQDRQQAQALAVARENREAAGAADEHQLRVGQLETMRQKQAGEWAEKLRVSGATPETIVQEIDAATGKLWTPQEAAALKATAATPEGAQQIITRLAPVQEPQVGEVDPTKDVIDKRTGKVIRKGTAAGPKTPTELAVAAADPNNPNQPMYNTALDLARPPKPEKPPLALDQQLLQAVVDGDTKKIGQIKATILTEAQARRDPAAAAMAKELAGLRVDEARARLEDRDVSSDKNQQKFEKQYADTLKRGIAARSGGIGAEDAKVQQANHLTGMLDQFYDPKTGNYNIPTVQLNELALGLAKLTAPGGNAGVQMMQKFEQRTAKGDLAGALSYITGQPLSANTQAITKMLKESIERQGQIAQTNREGELNYLRNLAPTDLDPERRAKLESVSLNPLRTSRVIRNAKTGETKLQVSTDGGKTWQ